MDLIQTPDNQFVDGTRRVPGTPVPAWWLNQLQGELFSILKAAGIEPDKADHSQVLSAIKTLAESASQVSSIDALRQYSGSGYVNVNGYYDTAPGIGGGLFVADKADKTTADNGGTVIVAADGMRWKRQSETVSAADFGILGDGSDETQKVQTALNVCAGERKPLGFTAGKNYGISQISIPQFSQLSAAGAVFKKLAASEQPCININSDVSVDVLAVNSPGSAADRGVRVLGSNVEIGKIELKSDAKGSNYGVHLQSSIGIPLKNIKIGAADITNYDAALMLFGVEGGRVDNIKIKCYRTGVYLRDVGNYDFNRAHLSEKSPNAEGAPGQNGLLVESIGGDYTTHDLTFANWLIEDAAEHGYRFGGQLGIRDVSFVACVSKMSGNHGGTSSGGCGFKVLGATSVARHRHKNFKLTACHVEDVNMTGGGIGNFAGYMFSVVDGVTMTGCTLGKKRNAQYSCWDAVSLESVTNISLNGNVMSDFQRQGIRVVSAVYDRFPGWDGLLDGLFVQGGSYQNSHNQNAPVVFFDTNAAPEATGAGTVKNVVFTGVNMRGGMAAIRTADAITYDNLYFDFDYDNGLSSGATPVIPGKGDAYYNARIPWIGYSPTAKNGSTIIDKLTGTVRVRRNNTWVTV
ncbi:hypothetical protein [Neisseria musculi]|uniref:Right handed beta helix region family protein n=2 Tax=Neisseria musculi TaxID=1815583 RepID=A0A7H1MCV9_9NEIS|nr:hypothetical protein [Neisseria musculi]QNT58237.1 hypothetical protein H7A79_0327 [Neisseria musculi]QNT59474.1 hypothetical protein H7A79_1094 [Neisseria musculi]